MISKYIFKKKDPLIILPQVQHHLPSSLGISGGAIAPREGLPLPLGMLVERSLDEKRPGLRLRLLNRGDG